MVKFLAIIAFCLEGECAFWADTEAVYYTEEECEIAVVKQMHYMTINGFNPEDMLPGCIPTKFKEA
jgi:hypothetical protein